MWMMFFFWRTEFPLLQIPQDIGSFRKLRPIALLLQAKLHICLLGEFKAVSIACLLRKLTIRKGKNRIKNRKKPEKSKFINSYGGHKGWLGYPKSVVSISSWSFYGFPHGSHPREDLGSLWCSRRNGNARRGRESAGCFRWRSLNFGGFFGLGLGILK